MKLRILAVTALLALPAGARAQAARVSVAEENLRSEPAGRVLAVLSRDARLTLGATRDGWREVTLDAWIWARSVRAEQRDGHDLIVAAEAGENLRAGPGGAVLGRARPGMLLDEVERRGGWVRVRRSGWIWGASIAGEQATPATGRAPAVAGAAAPAQWTRAGETGSAILSSPAGDTLARVQPLANVEVLAREGNWARVRMEGWVWAPSLHAPGDTSGVLRNVAVDVLVANPESFRGRLVQWTLQFIALDRADKIRTDFYEGEPFILARPLDAAGSGFVYIAVPPAQVERIRRLEPLSRITVTARVRSGRSALMGAPVLELVELADG